MLFGKKTRIEQIDIENPDPKLIGNAVKVLASGGFIVYPTDTAYGLGVNAFDKRAIRRMYVLKERDLKKPTHVIVRDWQMISEITKTTKLAKALHEKYMPGPITLILPKLDIVPDTLTAGLPTLGVRIPKCKVTQMLSQNFDKPYTTPSANKEGKGTPYSIAEVEKSLGLDGIDLVLDAGPLPKKPASTIVNLFSKPIKILREGEITSQEVMAFVMQLKDKKYIF